MTQAPIATPGQRIIRFWNTLVKVFLTICKQRCWVHKTANIQLPLTLKQNLLPLTAR